MALENAKEFLKRVMADEALRTRMAERKPADLAAMAKEMGYSVTAVELADAVEELRRSPQELNPDELDKAAGGWLWTSEDAPDGHEMGCIASYHHYNWSKENGIWCKQDYYCVSGYYSIKHDPI